MSVALQEVEYSHPERAKQAARRWRLRHAHVLPQPLRGARTIFGSCDWRKECGNKIAHRELVSAMQHIAELKQKPAVHNTGDAWLTVYLCRWCEWFHVGHSTIQLEREGSVVYSERHGRV